jgi:hypothetical protein
MKNIYDFHSVVFKTSYSTKKPYIKTFNVDGVLTANINCASTN